MLSDFLVTEVPHVLDCWMDLETEFEEICRG